MVGKKQNFQRYYPNNWRHDRASKSAYA